MTTMLFGTGQDLRPDISAPNADRLGTAPAPLKRLRKIGDRAAGVEGGETGPHHHCAITPVERWA
jgi:hypothetical protein